MSSTPASPSKSRARLIGFALVGLAFVALAVWLLRPAAPAVADYREELTELASGGADDPMVIAAQALLDATGQKEVRNDQGRRAAAWFENAAAIDQTGQAAFYAGLSYQLVGREQAARYWFEAVPDSSRYDRAARAALR